MTKSAVVSVLSFDDYKPCDISLQQNVIHARPALSPRCGAEGGVVAEQIFVLFNLIFFLRCASEIFFTPSVVILKTMLYNAKVRSNFKDNAV